MLIIYFSSSSLVKISVADICYHFILVTYFNSTFFFIAEEKTQTLGQQLEASQVELGNTKSSLDDTEKELKDFQSKVEELKSELTTLRESLKT